MASTAATKIGWIDDELDARSAEARSLALEGFEPIFASTATEGLALVRSQELSLLLLDLRLPDLDGLSVLGTLRREGICISVVILTGFGDFDAARRAGELGAVGFEAKPIFVERLVELVRKFAITTAGPGLDAPPVNQRLGHMPQLLTDISAIAAAQHREPADSRETYARAGLIVRDAGPLLRVLLKALVQLELSIPEFLSCLQAFREGVHRGFGTSGAMHASLLMQAMLHRTTRSELVESVLTRLEASKRPHAVHLEDLARDLNRDPTVLGRRVVQETGVGYREWRAGFVMRRAVRALALGKASISEIAWDVGFEHLSGFDRYFHTMLEVTPSEFRSLCELFGIVSPDFDGNLAARLSRIFAAEPDFVK